MRHPSVLTAAFSTLEKMLTSSTVRRWLVIALVSYSIFLRFWKVEYLPMANDADELAYVFAGQSLLQKGVPISWSSFTYDASMYRNYTIDTTSVNKHSTAEFVRPWFDHPMLLPFLTGSLSVAAGYDFPSVPPALLFRLPMLLFAAGTLVLIFLLSKEFFGYWPAMFSLALAGGSPGLTIIQRMVVGENGVIFFLLLALYAFIKKKSAIVLMLSAILATQAKAIGMLVVPIIAYAMVIEKKWLEAIKYGFTLTLLSIGSLAVFGYLIAGPEYLSALQNQSFRLVGWSAPVQLLANAGFQNYRFFDFSYYVILILGLGGISLAKLKTKQLLLGTVLILFATIWVSTSEQDFLGWYKVPLFVILTIGSAGYIYAKEYFLPISLLLITLVNNLGVVRYPTHPLPHAELLRPVVAVAVVISIVTLLWVKKVRYQGYILGVVMALFLLQGSYIADKYYESHCQDSNRCTVPRITFMQSVRSLLQ